MAIPLGTAWDRSRGARQKSAEAAHAIQNTPEADAAEVITHCEWCGAEYPVPSEE
jgi:hypothetical protein